MPGVINALSVFKKPLDDAYEAARDATKEKLKRWRLARNIQGIKKKISSVEKVKTIWQVDKAINLKEFYYPSKLLIEHRKKAVSKLKDLPGQHVVIQGIAGQGKSIFLRFLCSQENVLGERVPMFVELRRLGPGERLIDFLVESLRSYGFDQLDEQDLIFLAEQGKIALLLDGFDEISAEHTSRVIGELERFLERAGDNLPVVVTSRPDSGIERSARFKVVRVATLAPTDIPGILQKLCPEADVRANILAAIDDAGGRIRTLLTTPLMVTLLVLVYKAEQKIPEHFAEFYENLFWVLLVRHDRSKPGFVRRRDSGLSDSELKTVFESFSYLTRKNGHSKISSGLALDIVSRAADLSGVKVSSSAFLNDIIKVTCLLLEEGFDIYFIHKTVQEYFAASYIAKRPEAAVGGFYQQLREGRRWARWREELGFLSQID